MSFGKRDILNRRTLVSGLVSTLALTALPRPAAASSKASTGAALDTSSAAPRSLRMHNPHTDTAFERVYFKDGKYQEDALDEFSHFARDWRQDEIQRISAHTMNIAWQIQQRLPGNTPLMLYSGYRTPVTNRSVGGSRHSFHLVGRALDIHHPEYSVDHLAQIARSIRGGGLGKYPREGFIHIDNGPVRYWQA